MRIPGMVPFTALVVMAAGAGCSDLVTSEQARVRVLLTDAPSDHIAAAMVTVSRAYLVGGGSDEEAENGGLDVFNDPDNPRELDLMTLRDGVVAELGTAEVAAGTYRQLRLVVDDATVTLVDGLEFADGGNQMTLKVPSGSTSGIKVQLSRDIEAVEGSLTELVVDFDVDQNFKLQGNPDTPAGIHGILFTPVLKELSRGDAVN